MPTKLDGSCRCGAVRFSARSHTPVPYQLCYCSICRKQQGGGGYAINLGADAKSLTIEGDEHLGLYRARIEDAEHPTCRLSSGERRFCRECGSALWLYDPSWPELVHPDRNSGVSGNSVAFSLNLGGRRTLKKKKH